VSACATTSATALGGTAWRVRWAANARARSIAGPYSASACGMRSRSSSALAFPRSQISVAIGPGRTIDTSIPHGRSSRRSESLMPSIACLDAAYGPSSGRATRPPMEPMFTMRPRAVRSSGRKACVTAICPTLTVLENVWLSAQRSLGRPPALASRTSLRGVDERSRECLAVVGLAARADEPAGSIGHGDQRLLEIAMALALRPRVLLLDEPTAGMSVKESWEIVTRLREIRDRDRLTVLIVEHDMEIVMELAERVTVLHLGETLAEGTPDEVARNADVQRVYLGGR